MRLTPLSPFQSLLNRRQQAVTVSKTVAVNARRKVPVRETDESRRAERRDSTHLPVNSRRKERHRMSAPDHLCSLARQHVTSVP